MSGYRYKNARLVLENEIVDGAITVEGGQIGSIENNGTGVGEDFDGDFLIPGLIELHTDHLEIHYAPRPKVRWHKMTAIQAHDAQIATSGITTVFDCFRVGSPDGKSDDDFQESEMTELAALMRAAQESGRLRADHKIHLRCEVSTGSTVEEFERFRSVNPIRLVSLMDHAPGQRQFQTLAAYAVYYKEKQGLTDEEFDELVKVRTYESQTYAPGNRKALSKLCKEHGISIASHDDATLEHVNEAIEQGVRIAEFPTSIDAARASHENGMRVLMGAPNVVRGGSHSGNIAAHELAELGYLDILSSDYVPMSLIYAPFVLAERIEGMSLPKALSLVTTEPAKAAELDDRGSLKEGLRADFIRVRLEEGVPVVKSVWREGMRVA